MRTLRDNDEVPLPLVPVAVRLYILGGIAHAAEVGRAFELGLDDWLRIIGACPPLSQVPMVLKYIWGWDNVRISEHLNILGRAVVSNRIRAAEVALADRTDLLRLLGAKGT